MKYEPLVSIIIPCRNEELCISGCLESIIANDYPKERIEVVVIDGMSDDRTRDILAQYTAKYTFFDVLDTHKKEQQFALNIGITHARGDIIMRMDAHSTYIVNSMNIQFL